jgi:hypothetical protein
MTKNNTLMTGETYEQFLIRKSIHHKFKQLHDKTYTIKEFREIKNNAWIKQHKNKKHISFVMYKSKETYLKYYKNEYVTFDEFWNDAILYSNKQVKLDILYMHGKKLTTKEHQFRSEIMFSLC